MSKNNGNSKKATVIGLGLMGATLARLLIESGYEVTVWNRTLEKAQPLVEIGAEAASSAAEAIDASSLVIVCVYDYRAAHEILNAPETASKLAGKTIVQLTTGSPQEARESENWARRQGADYLDGAILAAPKQMGKPETMILFSGRRQIYLRSEEILKVFGGKLIFLGDNIGAASAMDLAVLSYTYGAALGFFHGVRIGDVEGFPAARFGEIVADFSPTIGEFVKYESDVIESGNFAATESPLRISIEAVERILKTAREAGINSDFPALASKFFQQAGKSGYADEEIGALIKVFRQPDSATTATGGNNV